MPFDVTKANKPASVLIVGAGSAGLMTALTLAATAPHITVTVMAEKPLGEGCASAWSQGGLAAAVGRDDKAARHAHDTMVAGAGTSDAAVVAALTAAAPAVIEKLAALGVQFARDAKGDFVLSREACHDTRRVLKAKAGDGFGAELMRALTAAVIATPAIKVVTGLSAERLLRREGATMGAVCGVIARSAHGSVETLQADAVVLATGGLGGLYAATTNPLVAVGRGIAMAARAGAVLADMEFVQFHPTALDIGEDPMPLATEALRGEGAVLRNSRGQRFMAGYHPMAELAPRDVVSRGIFAQIQQGQKTYLDCRQIDVSKFPALIAACARAGINPQNDLVPVAPAVHYHMGGVATDLNARTSLTGLWAVGEVAATGLHGANRLASNSLMEAVVMAERASADIIGRITMLADGGAVVVRGPVLPATATLPQGGYDTLRATMTAQCGVIRDADNLRAALNLASDYLDAAEARDSALADRALVSQLIIASALLREESRGGHFRSDFPQPVEHLQKRSFITLKDVQARLPALLRGATTTPVQEEVYA